MYDSFGITTGGRTADVMFNAADSADATAFKLVEYGDDWFFRLIEVDDVLKIRNLTTDTVLWEGEVSAVADDETGDVPVRTYTFNTPLQLAGTVPATQLVAGSLTNEIQFILEGPFGKHISFSALGDTEPYAIRGTSDRLDVARLPLIIPLANLPSVLSQGVDRITRQETFYQTQANTSVNPPAVPGGMAFNDGVGWQGEYPWNLDRPAIIPDGHVLWGMHVTRRWNAVDSQWTITVNWRRTLRDGYDVRYGSDEDGTNGWVYTYDSSQRFMQIKTADGWGPSIPLGAGATHWTQLYSHTSTFNESWNTTAYYSLSDWTQLQLRLLTNGIAGQAYQRYPSPIIPVSLFGELAPHSDGVGGTTQTLGHIGDSHPFCIIRWLVGDSDQKANNVIVGWDEGQAASWAQYNGLEIAYAMLRGPSAGATSKDVRRHTYRERGGDWSNTPVTLMVFGS